MLAPWTHRTMGDMPGSYLVELDILRTVFLDMEGKVGRLWHYRKHGVLLRWEGRKIGMRDHTRGGVIYKRRKIESGEAESRLVRRC